MKKKNNKRESVDKSKKVKVILFVVAVYVIWIIVFESLTFIGKGIAKQKENTISSTEEITTETESETESEETSTYDMEVACMVLLKTFVEDVLQEEYELFLSHKELEYNIDENGDGSIEVLYLPKNGTKVNLTITKEGNKYTTEYAMLDGLYEVDMSMLSSKYKVFRDLYNEN